MKIASGTDKFSTYKIKVVDGEILVEGYFSYGLDNDIKKILEQNDDIWNISLNSHGGRVAVAGEVAKLIETYKISTYTPEKCESACVVAFIAGAHRILGEGAQIGLHSYSFPGLTKKEERSLMVSDMHYYKNKGLSDAFLEKAFNTAADDMWYPTTAELIKNNVITYQVKSGKLISVKKKL